MRAVLRRGKMQQDVTDALDPLEGSLSVKGQSRRG